MLARRNVKPVSLWRDFYGDMDSWFAANGQFDHADSWMPAVDVIEEDDRYLLKADLPGVDAKDIDIVFEDNALTIKGERTENNEWIFIDKGWMINDEEKYTLTVQGMLHADHIASELFVL